MSIIVPEGEYTVTFIFQNEMTTKDFTFSWGIIDLDPVQADPTELADDAYAAATDAFPTFGDATFMADTWHFAGTSAMFMSGTGPIIAQHLDDVAGTGSDNDIPVNTAFLVAKNTASGGRANRGRSYVPPIMAGITIDTDGVWIGVDGTILTASFQAVHDQLVVGSWGPCVHHSDGSPGTPITSYTGKDLAATQRRRMR